MLAHQQAWESTLIKQLSVLCPHCHERVTVPRAAAESGGACPKCGGKIKILLEPTEPVLFDFEGQKTAKDKDTATSQSWWTVRKSLSLLQDSDPAKRRQAAQSLGELGDTKALEPLSQLLTDKDASVRTSAAGALEKLGWANTARKQVSLAVATGDYSRLITQGSQIAPALWEMLPRQPIAVQAQLLEVIGSMGNEGSIEPLLAILQQKHLRGAAYRALKRIPSHRTHAPLNAFIEEVKSAIAEVRAAIAQLVQPENAKHAVTTLQRLFEKHADLLPSELLLQVAPLDRVDAIVSVTLLGGASAARSEQQTLRCVGLQKLAIEELARRGIDLRNSGLEQVEAGNAAYHTGDYDAAADLYTEAIRRNDTLCVAYHNRGRAYQALQKWDAALVDFNRAADLDPTVSDSLLQRGSLYHQLGNYERAIEDYNLALKTEPGVEPLLGRAAVYLDSGQFEKAVIDLKQAAELQPDWKCLNNLGAAYFSLGLYQDAIDSFTQALQIEEHTCLLWNRAIAGFWRGHFAQVIEDLNAISFTEPNEPIYNLRGNAYLALHQLDNAIADYERHLEKHDSTTARLNLALALQMRGDVHSALQQYDQVLLQNPQLAVAWNNRGLIYRQLGELNLALADFGRAIDIDPQSTYYNNRAMTHLRRGNHKMAIFDMTAAIDADPFNAVAFHNRALMLLREDKPDLAEADYRAAMALEPSLHSSSHPKPHSILRAGYTTPAKEMSDN